MKWVWAGRVQSQQDGLGWTAESKNKPVQRAWELQVLPPDWRARHVSFPCLWGSTNSVLVENRSQSWCTASYGESPLTSRHRGAAGRSLRQTSLGCHGNRSPSESCESQGTWVLVAWGNVPGSMGAGVLALLPPLCKRRILGLSVTITHALRSRDGRSWAGYKHS